MLRAYHIPSEQYLQRKPMLLVCQVAVLLCIVFSAVMYIAKFVTDSLAQKKKSQKWTPAMLLLPHYSSVSVDAASVVIGGRSCAVCLC